MDPDPTGQVILDPDPERYKVSNPGGSRSATLLKTESTFIFLFHSY